MTREAGAIGSGVAVSQPLEERTNLSSHGVLPNPYPLHAKWRSRRPVYWSEQVTHWVMPRYGSASLAQRDHEHFFNRQVHTVVLPQRAAVAQSKRAL